MINTDPEFRDTCREGSVAVPMPTKEAELLHVPAINFQVGTDAEKGFRRTWVRSAFIRAFACTLLSPSHNMIILHTFPSQELT